MMTTQSKNMNLNPFLAKASEHYDFTGIDLLSTQRWFDSIHHVEALTYLCRQKHMSVQEALSLLDKLEAVQAAGIAAGFDRQQVSNLSPKQLIVMRRFNLSAEEVNKLEENQVALYVMFKRVGMTLDEAIEYNAQFTPFHCKALVYFMRVGRLSYGAALTAVKSLTELQAQAVCLGLKQKEFADVSPDALKEFLAIYSMKGLLECQFFCSLNRFQKRAVRVLHSWGVTMEEIKRYPWFNTAVHYEVLSVLMQERFMTFAKAVNAMEGLADYQLQAMSVLNISKEEALQLTHASQLDIILKFIHSYYEFEITPAFFADKPWFNSLKHGVALRELMIHRGFSLAEAIQEIDGLSEDQASQIINGYYRVDVVGLNTFMQYAVTLCKDYQLRGSQLIGNDWFNSTGHASALFNMVADKGKFHPSMMTQLSTFDEDDVLLAASNRVPAGRIKSLSIVQKHMLLELAPNNPVKRRWDARNILNADWLATEAQCTAIKLLRGRVGYPEHQLFQIVAKASCDHLIESLLTELENPASKVRWPVRPVKNQIESLPFFTEHPLLQEANAAASAGASDQAGHISQLMQWGMWAMTPVRTVVSTLEGVSIVRAGMRLITDRE